MCTQYGNACIAGSHAECAWSAACKTHGMCSAYNGQCIQDRCRARKECREEGACVSREGDCVAGSPEDCRASRACAEDGECYLSQDRHRCTDGTKRRSTGALIGGVISLGVGGLAALSGASLVIMADEYECDSLICVYDQDDLDRFHYSGVALLIVAGAAVSVGIPLLIYGAPKEADPSAVQQPAAWLPELRVGPGSGSLRWTF